MKILIDGDRLIVACANGSAEIKSRPVILALCEATMEQPVCQDSDRTRASQRLLREDLSELRGFITRSRGRFRWVGVPPEIEYNGAPLDATSAEALIEGDGDKHRFGSEVFNDPSGWKDVLTALEFLRADSDSASLEELNKSLESENRTPKADAVLNVLQWLFKRRLSTVAQELDPQHIEALHEARIRFAAPYVEQLEALWSDRRRAMLDGRLSVPKPPTAVSPTLLSYKHEVDGFIAMTNLRHPGDRRQRRSQIEEAAERAVHSFAVALIYAAIGHRLGRAVSCAANLASAYIELAVGGKLAGTAGPPWMDDRLTVGIKWLRNCWACASQRQTKLSERKLVRRCMLASMRRIHASLQTRKAPPGSRHLRLIVDETSKEMNKLLEDLICDVGFGFYLKAPDKMVATSEFCDLTELWRLALWRPSLFGRFPDEVKQESSERSRYSVKKERFEMLYTADGAMDEARAEQAVVRLAHDYKNTGDTNVRNTLYKLSDSWANRSDDNVGNRLARCFLRQVS